jgi:hypothetical protein
MVVLPKDVADNLNKIVNNYWNRVALGGNPWTWSNTRNSIQTPKFNLKAIVVLSAYGNLQEGHLILNTTDVGLVQINFAHFCHWLLHGVHAL